MGINFERFVREVCERLEQLAAGDPHKIAACNTGEKFELCVVEVAQALVAESYPEAKVEYTAGSHAFPDVVIDFGSNGRYGIEVKSSSGAGSKGWKINGNSVLGSTKRAVIDTYIIFGKTALGHQEFRRKRYEEAVSNVGVTHSPRYMIDMDIAPNETFFAKSGLNYQQISKSENPIGLVTNYFKSQGLRAWWLAESTPAAIRMFSELPARERAEMIGYCFAHFPEVFSSSVKKYQRSALWLTMRQSVVSTSLRDNFSASGRADVVLKTITYPDAPKIYKTLHKHRFIVRNALSEANAEELVRDWGIANKIPETEREVLKLWTLLSARKADSKHGTEENMKEMIWNIINDK